MALAFVCAAYATSGLTDTAGDDDPRFERTKTGSASALPSSAPAESETGEADTETNGDDALQRYGIPEREPETVNDARDAAGDDEEPSNAARDPFRLPSARLFLAQAIDPAGSRSPAVGGDGSSAMAQTAQEEMDSQAGFTLGGTVIVPTVGLSLGYDDNVTLSGRDEIDSWFYRVSPSIRVEIPTDRTVLSLIAALEIVRYEDSPIDDFESWYLRGLWTWDVSSRQRLDLYAQYADGVDRRGVGRREGDLSLIPLELDEWHQLDFGGRWSYGAVGARGRLDLTAGIADLEYDNNRGDGTLERPGTRLLDRDWFFYGGTFYWRVAPKTSLLADYRYTDIRYDLAPETNSEVQHFMLGATWQASARTSGRIQYGVEDRDYADPRRSDYSGPAWLASMTWRARSYSNFTLTGRRSSEEPDGNGDFSIREDLNLAWAHDWATRFRTTVDVGFGRDQFEPRVREDDLFYWGVAARYAYNQHVRLGASMTYYTRDSDVEQFNYDRTLFLLTLELSL